MENEFITVKEFAERTKLAEITIRQWITQGKIKSVKFGKARRIYKSELDAIKKGG